MLDRFKIITALQNVSSELFVGFAQEIDIANTVWGKISQDAAFGDKIHAFKQSLLVPWWQGLLAPVKKIELQKTEYTVLSVDGSQIYHDKHQGPPCFLINIGFMQLSYGLQNKPVVYGNEPFLTVKLDQEHGFGSTDFINMQREKYEFEHALQRMEEINLQEPGKLSVCLFDGSLIFFHLDAQDMEFKEQFLQDYCTVLEVMYQKRMLIAGYMSLPKTKELVNLCKLELVQFDDSLLGSVLVIDRLTDVDIAGLYLKRQDRSIVFASKAPICYLYPIHLRPHFCYLHVGSEIVRIEFPAWIGNDEVLVDQICAVAFDQAQKGHGYPVSLFEAHEQAVIKAADRDFFYNLLEKMSEKKSSSYLISQKSLRKLQPIL